MFGFEFEEQLAEEFGIDRVPGSGNQWHSKLDLKGYGARWSLKSTEKNSIVIHKDTIDVAIRQCYNLAGDGSIPLWAFRIGDDQHDMIMMRKEDFKMFQKGELKFIKTEEDGDSNVAKRRAAAKRPYLLRNDE